MGPAALGREFGTTPNQIVRHGRGGVLAQWKSALLVPLAGDHEGALLEIDVVDI